MGNCASSKTAGWYTNKDVVPTLQAMQEMVNFYQNNDFDVL